MSVSEPIAHKRNYPRFSAMSAAMVVNAHGVALHCAVENFSPGGAKLVGTLDLDLGERVRLLLQVPGRTPFSLQGTIVRLHGPLQSGQNSPVPATSSYAIAFDQTELHTATSPLSAANIESALSDLAKHQKTSPKLVLVFDPKQQHAIQLAHDLHAAGLETITVTTALDGIQWLLDSHLQFGAVLIASDSSMSRQTEFYQFLDEEYPHIPKLSMDPSLRGHDVFSHHDIVAKLRAHVTQKSAALPKP